MYDHVVGTCHSCGMEVHWAFISDKGISLLRTHEKGIYCPGRPKNGVETISGVEYVTRGYHTMSPDLTSPEEVEAWLDSSTR